MRLLIDSSLEKKIGEAKRTRVLSCVEVKGSRISKASSYLTKYSFSLAVVTSLKDQ